MRLEWNHVAFCIKLHVMGYKIMYFCLNCSSLLLPSHLLCHKLSLLSLKFQQIGSVKHSFIVQVYWRWKKNIFQFNYNIGYIHLGIPHHQLKVNKSTWTWNVAGLKASKKQLILLQHQCHLLLHLLSLFILGCTTFLMHFNFVILIFEN